MVDPLDETFGWLMAILERKRGDGSFYYATEALFDFLPAMLLSYGIDREGMTPQVESLLGHFARRAGVAPGMGREQTEAAIQSYLARNPLDEELVFEFHRGTREERVGRGNEDVAEAFAKYLAHTGRDLASLTEDKEGERPEGTIPSGPMAQFILRDKS